MESVSSYSDVYFIRGVTNVDVLDSLTVKDTNSLGETASVTAYSTGYIHDTPKIAGGNIAAFCTGINTGAIWRYLDFPAIDAVSVGDRQYFISGEKILEYSGDLVGFPSVEYDKLRFSQKSTRILHMEMDTDATGEVTIKSRGVEHSYLFDGKATIGKGFFDSTYYVKVTLFTASELRSIMASITQSTRSRRR